MATIESRKSGRIQSERIRPLGLGFTLESKVLLGLGAVYETRCGSLRTREIDDLEVMARNRGAEAVK